MNAKYVRPADRSLKGRVAIVTGGGARGDGIGNGRATAILLADDGAKVVVIDRNLEDAQQTQAMIRARGGEAMTLSGDVSENRDCESMVAAVVQEWGRVDMLVNNVGVGGTQGNAIELDITQWDAGLKVNVTSMMLMVRHCVPQMLKAGAGSIVNIASVGGLQSGHPSLLYPTSKGAVVQMTRAMAAHHGRDGIRVNCVAPGMVFTPMVEGGGMSEQKRQQRRERSLLFTEGSGWDVGAAVRFLSSDEARWITGVILPVDAGATAGRPVGEASPDHAYKKG